MPLELNAPKFDRPFEEIYRELRSRIPRYNPQWTNFNDGDPGITLLQAAEELQRRFRLGAVPQQEAQIQEQVYVFTVDGARRREQQIDKRQGAGRTGSSPLNSGGREARRIGLRPGGRHFR